MQWSSVDAQVRRFNVLADGLRANDHVMDLGCGLGDLLSHLRTQHGFIGNYTGVDQVAEFVDYARQRFSADPLASFDVEDIANLKCMAPCDRVVISGLFNNKLDSAVDNTDWLKQTVRLAFDAARHTVAFNALSTWVGRQEPGLFYIEPDALAKWCAQHITRRLMLRHDYNAPSSMGVPVDFTLFLFKD